MEKKNENFMDEWKRNWGCKTPPCEGLVEVVFRNGVTYEEEAIDLEWEIAGNAYDIMKWRKKETKNDP